MEQYLPIPPSLLSEGIIDKIKIKKDIYYAQPVKTHQTNFWVNYQQDTNKIPDDVTALGYDSAMFLKFLLEQCGENPVCIKEQVIKTVNWQSTRGNFSFDQYGDLKEIPFEIKQLE